MEVKQSDKKQEALQQFFEFKTKIQESKPEYIKIIDYSENKKGLRIVALVDWDKVNEDGKRDK